MKFLNVFFQQRLLEYIAAVILSVIYSYHIDPESLEVFKNPTIGNVLLNLMWVWALAFTIGFYLLFFLLPALAYFLGVRSPRVLALLNAVAGAGWSLMWVRDFKLPPPDLFWVIWALMVIAIYLIGVLTYRQLGR